MDKKKLTILLTSITSALAILAGIFVYVGIYLATPNYRLIKNNIDVSEKYDANKEETFNECFYTLSEINLTFDAGKYTIKTVDFINACPSYSDFRFEFDAVCQFEETLIKETTFYVEYSSKKTYLNSKQAFEVSDNFTKNDVDKNIVFTIKDLKDNEIINANANFSKAYFKLFAK